MTNFVGFKSLALSKKINSKEEMGCMYIGGFRISEMQATF
jgi:hypothetical protein